MGMAALAWAKRQNEARDGQRLKIFLPVLLRWAGQEERAHLLDLSSSGARMHARIAPSTKEIIEIVWEDRIFAGQCVWSRGSRFGIAFKAPIDKGQIVSMLTS
jgi:hypothetical protein